MKKSLICLGVLVGFMPLTVTASNMAEIKHPSVNKFEKMKGKFKSLNCPSGWAKVFDISGIKNKWSENSPVLTCKPNQGAVINCPDGTFFYVKGNENQDGYRTGEIGCHTPVW